MHYGRRCHACGLTTAASLSKCRHCGAVVRRPVHGSYAAGFFDDLSKNVSTSVQTSLQGAASDLTSGVQKEVADVTSSLRDKYGQVKSDVTSTIASAQKAVEQTKQGLLGGLPSGGPAAAPPKAEQGPGIGVYIAGAVAVGALVIVGATLIKRRNLRAAAG